MTTSSSPLLPPSGSLPTRGRAWKITLCLLLIFLGGAAVGAVVTLRVLRYEVARRSNPAAWTALLMNRVDSQVRLTPDQRHTLEPLVRASMDEVQQVRDRAFAEIAAVVERAHAKANPTLSPEQQRRLDTFIKSRKDLIHRWSGDRVPEPPLTSPSPVPP